MTLRLMLDTPVFDDLLADSAFSCDLRKACGGGKVELILTHVQLDEGLAMERHKPEKVDPWLQAVAQVAAQRVATSTAAWEKSRWGQANFTSDADEQLIEDLCDGNSRHLEDVMLVLTRS